MQSLNKLKAIGGLLLFLGIGIAAMKQPANDHFKNLQVLPKNITVDSLNKLMEQYSVGLGVDCNYCHAKDKKADTLIFEKDDKMEKEIARKMMRMTMDINEKYFRFNNSPTPVTVVTCLTCHRGEPIPK
jgi:hypothetical protein